MESIQEKASQIFLQYYQYVGSVAIRLAPAAHLQEDIIHDAFLDFVEKAEQWDYESDMKPLLRRITQISAQRYWRSYTRNMPESLLRIAELLRVDGESDDENDRPLDDQLVAMDNCIKKLTANGMKLVEDHYYHGKSYETLAQETGQSIETVYKAMSRIRKFLRDCIDHTLEWEESHVDW